MARWISKLGGTILAVLVLLSLVTLPATSATISSETTYTGSESGDQAIQVNVTLSPDVVSRDVIVRVADADQALIDVNTISSPQPGIEKVGPRRFEIDQLDTDEEIKINFRAYPRTLDEQTISVAYIQYTSEQIQDTKSERVNVNMTGSPALRLASAQERISGLESENQQLAQQVDRIRLWRTLGIGLTGVGLVVAVGSVVGMYRWRNSSIESEREKIHNKLISELDDIKQDDGHAYEPSRGLVKAVSSRLLDHDLPERHQPGFSTSTPGPTTDEEDLGQDGDTDTENGDGPDLGGGFE